MTESARVTSSRLTAQLEPFDSFWEAPEDVEKGYSSFAEFYRHNYLKFVPGDRQANILVVSCGPGYFLKLLKDEGYSRFLGIDSDAEKLEYAKKRNLPCRQEQAFDFLERTVESYDLIFCEQEINHLTKLEMLAFLQLCQQRLDDNGRLIVHAINGANPLTGSESLALNFDHYNTLTEYSLRQVLEHSRFRTINVFPLRLYVFYKNPLNYVGMLATTLFEWFFRLSFILYGKKNRIFTKKIAAVAQR